MSELEQQLAFQLRAEGITDFEREFRFCERRWRFDLCWPQHMLAAELQGGLYQAGRHNRGAALEKEYEKLNAAQAEHGWTVLLFGPSQIRSGEALDTIKKALERA